jgi:hypothetical protein
MYGYLSSMSCKALRKNHAHQECYASAMYELGILSEQHNVHSRFYENLLTGSRVDM